MTESYARSGARFVGQHHQHAGGDHEPDQGQRAAAEAEGVGVSEACSDEPAPAACAGRRTRGSSSVAFALGPRHDRPRKDGPPNLSAKKPDGRVAPIRIWGFRTSDIPPNIASAEIVRRI